MVSKPAQLAVTDIFPTRQWTFPNWRELWNYRELLYFLVWRDLKVRYKQTALGVLWSVLQPFLTMVVFSVLFGRLAGLPSENIPYPLLVYAALLPWQLFTQAMTDSSASLVANQHLLTKVYFPRLIIPIVPIITGGVDFLMALVVFAGLCLFYSQVPAWTVLFLPVFLGLALITAAGAGLWLSALNVKYRDVRYAVPFLSQLWLFISPIGYSTAVVPEQWRWVYALNPMVGVIDGFRWALFGRGASLDLTLVTSSIVAVTLLMTGLIYFRRAEKSFADIV